MARGIALEPQRALASASQMIERRAPHGPEPADDDIEMGHNLGLSELDCHPLLHASVPIPKFAYPRGALECELRNQRDTGNFMTLVV
jgi:hypothetical protein